MARVFVYRVFDIGFLTIGLLKSGFDLESKKSSKKSSRGREGGVGWSGVGRVENCHSNA
jgi:hypothetical protein